MTPQANPTPNAIPDRPGAAGRRFAPAAALVLAGVLASCNELPVVEPPDEVARPIHIGTTFPATGRFAVDGARMERGYRLAVEMLNEAGGIDGREVRLTALDDESEPLRAAEIYLDEFVLNDEIDLILAPYASSITEAVVAVAEAAGRPLVAGLAASTEIWSGRSREWSVQLLNPAEQTLGGAVAVAAAQGIGTLALVYEDSRFPVSAAEGVREAAREHGLDLVMDVRYPVGGADHRELASRARELGAQMFLGGVYTGDAIEFVHAMDEVRYRPLLAAWGVGADEAAFIEAVGDLARCAIGNSAWVPSLTTSGPLATSAAFVERYEAAYGETPGYTAAAGFGAVELTVEAARASIAQHGEIRNDAVRDHLFSTTTQTVVGPYAVAPLGDPDAGLQQLLERLQVQWQDDGSGGLHARVVHPPEVAEADACVNRPEEIVVAGTLGATGAFALEAEWLARGYELAADMVNEAGGIDGRPLRLLIRDDESSAERAASLYAEFVADESIAALLGPYSSTLTAAVTDLTEAAARPMVAGAAAAPAIWMGRNREWTVQVHNTADNFLRGTVQVAAAEGLRSIALAYQDADFPRAFAEGVRDEAARQGLKILLDQSFPTEGVDYEAVAKAARDADADVFLGGGYPGDAVGLTRAAAAVGYAPRLMSWGLGSTEPGFAAEVGALARCVAGYASWVPGVATSGAIADNAAFVRRHEEAYGATPGFLAAGAFGAVELLVEALRESIAATGDIDRQAVRDRLFASTAGTVFGAYGVRPLGDPDAGLQHAATGLQLQWQEDAGGDLAQRVIHPAALADASACIGPPQPITVAATLSTTGPFGTDGRETALGYRLAVDMLNERGGIEGRPVRLVVRDDRSSAEAAAELYRQFVAGDSIDALLGPYSSTVTAAAVQVAEEAGWPLVAGLGAAPEIWAGRGRQWSVQVQTSAANFLRGTVEMAAREGLGTVALVYQDAQFPSALAEGVRAAARDFGLAVVLDRSFPTQGADYEALAAAARDAGAEVFAGGGYTPDAIALTRAAAAVGYEPALTGWGVGPAESTFGDQVGGAARCVTGYSAWVPGVETQGPLADAATFVRRHEEAYVTRPGFTAAAAFGTVELLYSALTASLAATGRIDRAAMRDHLFGADTETVFGAFAVEPLGSADAGAQRAAVGLQVQWQDDGMGGLVQRVVHPPALAQAEPCFR